MSETRGVPLRLIWLRRSNQKFGLIRLRRPKMNLDAIRVFPFKSGFQLLSCRCQLLQKMRETLAVWYSIMKILCIWPTTSFQVSVLDKMTTRKYLFALHFANLVSSLMLTISFVWTGPDNERPRTCLLKMIHFILVTLMSDFGNILSLSLMTSYIIW